MQVPRDAADAVRDVSAYPDVTELMLVSDGLLTDYSSVMFDYALLDRPLLFFAPDADSYGQERGTYFLAEDKDSRYHDVIQMEDNFQYNKGVKMYQKAFSIDQSVFDPNRSAMVEGGGSREQRVAINYYIAQTFAKAGNQDQALIFLRKAMDEGFKDRKRLIEDSDFAVLRTTPQFQKLLDAENLN